MSVSSCKSVDFHGSFYTSSNYLSHESRLEDLVRTVEEPEEEGSSGKLPDGGYGWVVALVALLLNSLLTLGLATFSILFVDFVDYFQASKTQVSWVGAIYLASMLASCVHAEIMTHVGTQKMGMILGVIASISYIGSSFAHELWVLYITYGFIPGMIFCYYGLAGIVTLHHWFDKKISLAMAINFSGIAIGHFMWAPLTSWLVSLYTWRGALLILAAINLHCLILLYLLKTPEQYYGASYQKRHESIKSNTSQSPSKCIHKFIPNICQQPTYIAFHFLNVLFNMSYLVGMSYFPTRYVLTGGDKQTAAFLQALVGITMGILRPLHGLAADKIAKKRTCLFFIYEGLSGGALIMSALLDHFAWIAICAILFASFAAGYVVVTIPTITDLWGREQVPYIGAHLYMDNAVAGLVFNPISGVLMDATQTARAPFLLFGSLQVLGVFLGCLLIRQAQALKTARKPIRECNIT